MLKGTRPLSSNKLLLEMSGLWFSKEAPGIHDFNAKDKRFKSYNWTKNIKKKLINVCFPGTTLEYIIPYISAIFYLLLLAF